jgi:hypothetical protein
MQKGRRNFQILGSINNLLTFVDLVINLRIKHFFTSSFTIRYSIIQVFYLLLKQKPCEKQSFVNLQPFFYGRL